MTSGPGSSGPGSGEGGLSLLAVAAVVLVALACAVLPRGLPGRAGGWEGLGGVVDGWLPDGGRVVHERVRRQGPHETLLRAHSTLGGELAMGAIYLLAVPLALVALRRRDPELAIRPGRRDLQALLGALTLLVPLYVVVGFSAAGVAAAQEGGLPLRRAVYLFVLPPLADATTAVWPVLRLVVLAPLAEELVWRGLVYRGLRRRLRFGPASVGCALLFGLWHLMTGWSHPLVLANQYLFALVACALVERTGSLAAPWLLHALGNALAVALYLVCMFRPAEVLALFGVGP